MGFGPAEASASDASAGEVGDAVDAIERIMAELGRIRNRLSSLGQPLAAVYAAGSFDALAYALEAALAGLGDVPPLPAGAGLLDLRLRAEGPHPYAVTDVGALAPPFAAGPSIGSAILADRNAVERLRSDEIAAGLMAAALAHADWLHLASDAVFHGDALAARAVVGTIAGRDTFPSWTRRQMGGLIDRGSADLLSALGWRRMTGAALPGVAAASD